MLESSGVMSDLVSNALFLLKADPANGRDPSITAHFHYSVNALPSHFNRGSVTSICLFL